MHTTALASDLTWRSFSELASLPWTQDSLQHEKRGAGADGCVQGPRAEAHAGAEAPPSGATAAGRERVEIGVDASSCSVSRIRGCEQALWKCHVCLMFDCHAYKGGSLGAVSVGSRQSPSCASASLLAWYALNWGCERCGSARPAACLLGSAPSRRCLADGVGGARLLLWSLL